jgi:adenylosuccinate lyase
LKWSRVVPVESSTQLNRDWVRTAPEPAVRSAFVGGTGSGDVPDPLEAVSPLDGRYADRTGPLREYASEMALMRARLRVEAEYLLALAELSVGPDLSDAERARVRASYREFDLGDARTVKRIEVEGDGERPPTRHDVKAVEYFLADRVPDHARPWVHFGLTSEDVTNLAYRLLVRGALREVLVPALRDLRDALADRAREHREVAMLAHTHGQPATPTTFGKELAVFAARLGRTVGNLERAESELAGKLGGATGTFGAHEVGAPEVDWRSFAREFVTDLGLEYLPLTTQVNPGDDLAAVFSALRGVNAVLLDLARDAWGYTSRGYLRQRTREGEAGSSTMPHKVNPIDFENAEGNLAKANADLTFLADRLTTSRLQRDLSDSTVRRTVGATLAHCLLAYRKLAAGLDEVAPDEAATSEALARHPEVLAEAVQTALRRAGHDDAYERVRAATRGERVELADLRTLAADLPDPLAERLRSMAPADYTGLAADLVDALAEDGTDAGTGEAPADDATDGDHRDDP